MTTNPGSASCSLIGGLSVLMAARTNMPPLVIERARFRAQLLSSARATR
jgi:hypothetical protein